MSTDNKCVICGTELRGQFICSACELKQRPQILPKRAGNNTTRWIRRAGLFYGVCMGLYFIVFILASFGLPPAAPLGGIPMTTGLVVTGFAPAFLLLPYRRLTRSPLHGTWVLVGFVVFIMYATFYEALSLRSSSTAAVCRTREGCFVSWYSRQ